MRIYKMIFAVFFSDFNFSNKDKTKSKSEKTITRFLGNLNGHYNFSNELNKNELIFSNIPETLLQRFNFQSKENIGKYFDLTYTIEQPKKAMINIGSKPNSFIKRQERILTLIEIDELKGY